MVTASISDLKNKLSAYLDRVRAGETILVLDRGVPVARLEASGDPGGRIAQLERNGLVRRGTKRAPSLDELARPGEARVAGRPSVLDALLEERREGR